MPIHRQDVIMSPALMNGPIVGVKPRRPSHDPWAPSKKPVTPRTRRPIVQPGIQTERQPERQPQPPIPQPVKRDTVKEMDRAQKIKEQKVRNIDVNIRKIENQESAILDKIQEKSDTINENIQQKAQDPNIDLPTEDPSIDRDKRTLVRVRKTEKTLKDKKINLSEPTRRMANKVAHKYLSNNIL